MMRVDLVFEGGGILGLSFVGAYHALKNRGYQIERCAGTSAGAIISALIIAGYTSEELIKLMNETDFQKILDKTKLGKTFLIGKLLSLIYYKGIYHFEALEKWIEKLLLKKGIFFFRDIMMGNQSPLKIIAADITDRKLLILPDDLKYYGLEPGDFSIARAVAMSCSIPFFFTPIKLQKEKQINYIVDGGLFSPFPIWIFDVEGIPRYPTLGLKIKDSISYSSRGEVGIISYLKDLINATFNKDETTYLRDEDLVRTITIDFDHQNKATDFNISSERCKYLYKCGYDSTNEFLKKWNFSEYVKRYRINKGS